jgi:protein-S-isoprenylcysteine O-methyltransferase Ste14
MKCNLFTALFVPLMVIISIQRVIVSFRQRTTLKGNVRFQWSFPVLMILFSGILVGTVLEYFFVEHPLNLWVAGGGLGVFLCSAIIRSVAIRTLGRYWSLHVEIRPEHQLISSGIYGVVRHPIYLSVILESLSIPLIGNAYYTLLGAVCLYWPVLLWRLRMEEQAMVEKFGDLYVDYRRRVPAIVPFSGFLTKS